VNVIIGFPIEKTFDVMNIREPFNAMELVLESSFVQVSGHPDVESARDAAHDVNAVCFSSAHEGIGFLRLRICFAKRSKYFAQDDRVERVGS
jgi:hypothetical protein